MNNEDFDFIENRLKVKLPTAFRALSINFPNTPRDNIATEHGLVVPMHADLFVIEQLQHLHSPFEDCYHGQPTLREKRFLEIGAPQGFGKFCMVGNDATNDQLWTWDDDDGFALQDWSTLSEFLSLRKFEHLIAEDPFSRTSGTYVTRADHPVRSLMMPILPAEWDQFVEECDMLIVEETYEKQNPFTGEWDVVESPLGRAELVAGERTCEVRYHEGHLSFAGNDTVNLLTEIAIVANALQANIWSTAFVIR